MEFSLSKEALCDAHKGTAGFDIPDKNDIQLNDGYAGKGRSLHLQVDK